MGISAESHTELLDMACELIGGDVDDYLVSIYLSAAEEAILRARFPYDASATWDDTAGAFDMKAVNMAVQLYAKRGAEGEKSHEENGTKRSYGGTDIPRDMLRGITPMAAVPR